MTKQGSNRYSKNGQLAVRWYYSESQPATVTQATRQEAVQPFASISGTLAVGPDAVGDNRPVPQLTGKALPAQADGCTAVYDSQHNQTKGSLTSHMQSICKAPQLTIKAPQLVSVFDISPETLRRLVIGCLMLTGYFVLLASGF